MRRTLLLTLALLPGAAFAHHGWGGYDANAPQTLTGEVVAFDPSNPHAALKLRTPDKTWDVVLSPPSRMVARGLPLNRIRVGDTVQVMGYPHRRVATELRAEWIRVGEQVTQLR
jgi:hypothetical protein